MSKFWRERTGSSGMADAANSCPKCSIPREEGHNILDRRHLTAADPLTWIARWRTPTLKERMFSDPLQGKEYRSIRNDRCTGCGYLEAFAK